MWHPGVITSAVLEALGELRNLSAITGFYLGGGTGLALHLGHRRSADLDLFHQEPFDEERLIDRLAASQGFSVVAKSPHTLHCTLGSVKISFLSCAYPLLFPLQDFLGLSVADPRDIACMKLSAIAARGARRDFIDLYAVAKDLGLAPLLELFHRKYAQVRYNKVHLLKALLYFADAEREPMPDMIAPYSWEEVKEFFTREVPRLQ